MKLRQLAEDFVVEELSAVRPDRGRFALYRLRKRGYATLDAVRSIARLWKVPRQRIAFGGLKDVQAVTEQYLTIEAGPRRSLRQSKFQLKYLGQCERPFHASDMTGNRFRLTLRQLGSRWQQHLPEALAALTRDGLPNYFDDQRFWSLGRSGKFVAAAWIRRDYEEACRLVLTDPLDSDRPEDRRQRARLAKHWGDWSRVASGLEPGDGRSMVEYLAAQPGDYRRALTRIAHDQRSIYLAAYQGYLWNELLNEHLQSVCLPGQLAAIPLRTGQVHLYRELNESQRADLTQLLLPLPSARLAPASSEIEALMTRVLARHNLERRQIKIDYPRDTFFSKGERRAIVFAQQLSHRLDADELHPGKQKAILRFELPRGSYATMLVKRVELLV